MIFIAVLVIAALAVAFAFMDNSKLPPMPAGCTDDDIRSAAAAGRTLQAIKWYRELHGAGLREAKAAVEAMSRSG